MPKKSPKVRAFRPPVPFLAEVEAYLSANPIGAHTFGVEAFGDPKFVYQLREGREPRRETIRKARDFMDGILPKKKARAS